MNQEIVPGKIKAILGIGDAMVDLTTMADQIPAKGGNIWSTAVKMTPGGTTANIAAGLCKLGIPSQFAGVVGRDPYGTYLVDDFKRMGIETRDIKLLEDTFTGFILSIIDPNGERTFIACAKGAANFQLTEVMVAGIDFSQFSLSYSTGVCLVEEPSRSALLTAFEKMNQVGCRLYFDPNLRLEGDVFPEALKDATWKAFSNAAVVLIGDKELDLLCPNCKESDAVNRILERGPELVVLKQGEKGATLFTEQENIHCPAFEVTVINTQGAGDAFDAGFIAGQLRGYSGKDTLKYACGVAGLKVASGGSRAVPTHEQVLDFIRAG